MNGDYIIAIMDGKIKIGMKFYTLELKLIQQCSSNSEVYKFTSCIAPWIFNIDIKIFKTKIYIQLGKFRIGILGKPFQQKEVSTFVLKFCSKLKSKFIRVFYFSI